jgi:predicted RNA-binding protein
MCEFTVKRKIGPISEKVGEDIIFFQYDESGESHLADILDRSKVEIPNGLVSEINMLENRHDITLIESDLVPFFVRFLTSIQDNNTELKTIRAKELIAEIEKELS